MKKTARTNREMIERWRRVGPKLEAIRRRELRELNDKDYTATIEGLLEIGFMHARKRSTSGLVELQRLFAKARR